MIMVNTHVFYVKVIPNFFARQKPLLLMWPFNFLPLLPVAPYFTEL